MIANRHRILMVIPQLGYGGAETAFLRLANYLALQADVTLALMARDYGGSDYSAENVVSDLQVEMLDEGRIPQRGPFDKLRRWIFMRNRLASLKRNHDVTISFLSGANLLNAISGKPPRAIVSERGSKQYHVGIPPLRKWLWLRIFDPITYRRATFIVPASAGYAQEISTIAGSRSARKIVPIEGGIDAVSLIEKSDAPADEDIVRFCDSPTAVYCGRIDRGKGIDLLIVAFARIRKSNPIAKLLLIGDGPLQETIATLAVQNGIPVTYKGDPTAGIFLSGYRADPMRHFRFCRVFLFPSLHEGLPNALIEGVAAGIPILAADCPWGPRSVLGGLEGTTQLPLALPHGTLMPLPDSAEGVAAWESALTRALTINSQRRPVAERLAAVARFDLEETGKQWRDLIEKVMQEPREKAQ